MVEGTEGVLEAVVISIDGPTLAEAGVKYLKSTSERREVLQQVYINYDS